MSDFRGLFQLIFGVVAAFAVGLSNTSTVHAAMGSVSPASLSHQIAERVRRVDEFRFIREAARELGVRVYLFGGTAAGFAHYVKWDLLRETGSPDFQTARFDYDYTNIYRSTQDLDIVVDGTSEKAAELERRLMARYKYLQGNKSAWEIRLLREKRGDKIALLENPDFLNQHTDSNSTGMIEISESDGREIVKDLRDWNSKEPQFLRDVSEGKIHFYHSGSHNKTFHFLDGNNPAIFSVIRFLTKAFQYDLQIRDEDRPAIERIIREFKPSSDLRTQRAQAWIEKNGPKLFQHAVDIEYAWNTIEKLGLRARLMALSSTAQVNTLGWWMNREPLRTKPLAGSGKTARQLGLDIVAHETTSFLAYESITRSSTGEPNVFVSRPTGVGETAAHGEGFYTRVGTVGARGTRITIRFHLHPDAVEGRDFTLASDDFVVVHNKSALTVIFESLNIGPIELLQMVINSEIANLRSEHALVEKMRRRLMKFGGPHSLNVDERAELERQLSKGGETYEFLMTKSVWEIFPLFEFGLDQLAPEKFRSVLLSRKFDLYNLVALYERTGWRPAPEVLDRMLVMVQASERNMVELFEKVAKLVVANSADDVHSDRMRKLITAAARYKKKEFFLIGARAVGDEGAHDLAYAKRSVALWYAAGAKLDPKDTGDLKAELYRDIVHKLWPDGNKDYWQPVLEGPITNVSRWILLKLFVMKMGEEKLHELFNRIYSETPDYLQYSPNRNECPWRCVDCG